MVDRRKLIVGGAAVTTLVAIGGSNAVASAARRPDTTAAHARRILDLVDADLGLVDPPGLQELFVRNYPIYRDSDPRDPQANDLDAWARQRMVDLCGTDSFADAGTEVPQTRTLLAFSVVAYSQRPDSALPEITRSMPVADMLQRLEPDFLPVLVGQINEKADRSQSFTNALQAGTAELDRILAEHMRHLSEERAAARASAKMSDREMLDMAVGILGFISFMSWISRGLK